MTTVSHAQNRGVSATASRPPSTRAPCRTRPLLINVILVPPRDEAKANDGQTLPVTGNHSVILDMNTITWVSQGKFLDGRFGCSSATLPFSKNDLTLRPAGQHQRRQRLCWTRNLSTRSSLGWKWNRAAVRVMYVLPGADGAIPARSANDNVGSGYWTHALSSGQTFLPDREQTPCAVRVSVVRIPHRTGRH